MSKIIVQKGRRANADQGEEGKLTIADRRGGRVYEPLIFAYAICEQPLNMDIGHYL